MHVTTAGLQHLLLTWGYVAVFFFVAVESLGVPVPAETMLITAAAYAGAGHLMIQWVVLAAALGAIIGDNTGYLLGRIGGRPLALRFGKYIHIDAAKLDVAERFFDRHGDKTVFLGRFVALLRTWAAFLAGLNRMHWAKFLVFNAAGGIVWSVLYGTLAFELGKNLPLLHRVVDTLGIAGIVLAVLVAAALFILHRRAGGLMGRFEQQEEDVEDPRKPVPSARPAAKNDS